MEQINYLESLKLNEFFLCLKNLTNKQIMELINNPYLINLSVQKFNYFFFNLDFEHAQVLLQNEKLYSKVINLPSKNKTILNSLYKNKPELFKCLVENKYILNNIEIFMEFINSISYDEVNNISSLVNLNEIQNYIYATKKDSIIKNLKLKFKDLPEDFYFIFCSKLNNNEINIIKFLKIKNSEELILYLKFGVLVETVEKNKITLKNGLVLPYDKIVSCKGKYITSLIKILKQKNNDSDEVLLEAAIKLYYIFGFDNAKKIIDNKFSFMNDASLIKINDFEFKDARREYRLHNKSEFYHHEMINEIINKITKEDNSIFAKLTSDKSEENIEKIRREFMGLFLNFKGSDLQEKIKEKIQEKITARENFYKNQNLNKLKLKQFKEPHITAKFVCELFKNVQINKVMEYDEQTLNSLQKFFLGDTRNSNDCLFRLILNDSAFGLENDISKLINDYKYINQIIKKGKLSSSNILDIIDILKVKLYELRPNEEDINLSTISRLINAAEYKDNLDIDVVAETCKLHLDRKKKIYSTIPTVKGKTSYYTYEVAPFNAEYLLTAGLDAKNCFRVVGFGSDFFKYCLTNRNAVVVYLKDKDGNKHICPVIRTGNAISCNGIDPEVEDGKKKQALDALAQCFSDMIKAGYNPMSEHYENIEVATITDLHMKEFFANYKYPKYTLQQYIPIDCECYTDFNKEEINHYILSKLKTYNKNYYYNSPSAFFQDRDPIYEFDATQEFDIEKISIIVNSIAYSSIDTLNSSESDKNKKKRNFKKINVANFKYIIGNKDWYVAIDENHNIDAKVLSYDFRSKNEYYNALIRTLEKMREMTGENLDRKSL